MASITETSRLDPIAIRALIAQGKKKQIVFSLLGLLCLAIAILTLTAAFLDLLIDGWGRLRPEFFMNFPSRRASEAGILSAWVGSALVLIVTMVAAVPLGVGAAIYLEEYGEKGGWFKDLIEINVTNLAGVPSIIYGLLALGLFVYYFKFGQSILSAGLTLALLILPIVIVATREALRAVPVHIREAAYGVGATRWQMISDHLVPYAAGGIMTGVIIGLARAIGETAPIITIGALTFIAFLPPSPVKSEFPFLSFDWLWSEFTVLPIQMFNWVSRPDPSFHANAAAAGIVLLVMCLAMNALAIYIRYQVRKKIKW
ncbi:MAG: phosphate ABC transporter permease PstA [Casimicrobiaceae bacterium]|nr:phosphate ABC transporter permease PstA [Casimicrobiaceae bacterium]MDW8311454.1 phosphate ABC transporter permease PstA [Burkholderiales bacterium]